MKTTGSKQRPKRSLPQRVAAQCNCLAQHPQRWIGIQELAQLLGVSVRSLYEGGKEAMYLKSRAVHVGRHLRWQLSFVLEWMERQQREADRQATEAELARATALAAPDKVVSIRSRKPGEEAGVLAIREQIERARQKRFQSAISRL